MQRGAAAERGETNWMTSSAGAVVAAPGTAVSRKTNEDEPSANLSRAPRFSFGEVS